MSLYEYSDRSYFENIFSQEGVTDSQIYKCDFDNICLSKNSWSSSDMNDTNMNNARISKCNIIGSTFSRSSFMNSHFKNSSLENVSLNGLTLIKTQWLDTELNNSSFSYCTLQRAYFDKVKCVSSVFTDFEGIRSSVKNSIFVNTTFDITYGSGSNGFSEATIENSLFYNCRFSGYPFRGATIKNCLFIGSYGEIGDEMECDRVYGIRQLRAEKRELCDSGAALELLGSYNKGNLG